MLGYLVSFWEIGKKKLTLVSIMCSGLVLTSSIILNIGQFCSNDMFYLLLTEMYCGKFSCIISSNCWSWLLFHSYMDFVLSQYTVLQMCFSAYYESADLAVMNHPILNFSYYLVRLPALILFPGFRELLTNEIIGTCSYLKYCQQLWS